MVKILGISPCYHPADWATAINFRLPFCYVKINFKVISLPYLSLFINNVCLKDVQAFYFVKSKLSCLKSCEGVNTPLLDPWPIYGLIVCLWCRISVTTEPIWFSFTVKLDTHYTTLQREIAPRLYLIIPNFSTFTFFSAFWIDSTIPLSLFRQNAMFFIMYAKNVICCSNFAKHPSNPSKKSWTSQNQTLHN